jgi:hypothetical protein
MPVRGNLRVPQLASWRRWSAALSVLQVVLLLSVFALVLVATVNAVVVVAAAVVVVLLEVIDALFAHEALRIVPADYSAQAHASRPLRSSDRRVVTLQLAGTVVVWVLVVTELPIRSPRGETWIGVAALAVALIPGWLALVRVLRHDSWLAVSRIPLARR